MGKKKEAIKVIEVIESGELNINPGDLFEDILSEAGNAMDACNAWDIIGPDILFKGNDGKWYTAAIQTRIGPASKELVKEKLAEKEQKIEDEDVQEHKDRKNGLYGPEYKGEQF